MTLLKKNSPDLTDFFDDNLFGFKWPEINWSPAVNVVKNDSTYEIELAAPGFDKEDFNVIVDDGVLTITAKTSKEHEEKGKKYTRREFSTKSFTRSFTLPKDVVDDQIKAIYKKGILNLMLQKKASTKEKVKKVAIA